MNAGYFQTDNVHYGDKCPVCREQLPYGSIQCFACYKILCTEPCRDEHDKIHEGMEKPKPVIPRLPGE